MRWLVAGLLVMLVVTSTVPVAAQAPEAGRNQIVTTGTGQVEVPPTQATVTVGAQLQRTTAAEASGEVSRIADQILARLQQLGIRRQEIRTSGVQLHPVFSTPRDGAPRVVGYQATYTLTVTITDMRLIGPVIDESVKAGANQVRGIVFGLRDPSPARREALTLAVREARDKADAIARAAGLQIKAIERIVEESGGVEVRALERALPAPGQPVPTPIEPGLIAVTARVTMVFSF